MDPLRPSLTPLAPPTAGLAATAQTGMVAVATSDVAVSEAISAPMAALATAKAEAAMRQATLGPLLANLEQALSVKGLPAPLRAAIAQAVALQTPTTAPFDGQALKTAVAQSGLFLEAGIAATGAPAMDLKAALLILQQALGPDGPRTPRRPQAAPPPVRGGLLSPQAPAAGSLPADISSASLPTLLRGEVEHALARQTLHQLASLPDGGEARWMLEFPLATPQGPAMVQLAIEPDADDDDASPRATSGWQARFSLDVPPLGPVHVRLRLSGDQTAVTVWAEQPQSLERLRERGGELAGALSAEVNFHAGAPAMPGPAPGSLVDRAS